MDEIRVTTRAGQTAYRPGDQIEGSASWNLPSPPTSVEIRLVWFTRGKGTPDISVVETQLVANPASMGDTAFRFLLPDGPHSFSGKLISLLWTVEAVAFNGSKMIGSGRQEFTLSPDGQEIILKSVDKPLSPAMSRFQQRKAQRLRQNQSL
jgi:hypothetical protein